jgi:hypothetical protein
MPECRSIGGILPSNHSVRVKKQLNHHTDFINLFPADAIGSPLVRVLFTKGMIAADFLGDTTGTGLDMPSQTHRQNEVGGRGTPMDDELRPVDLDHRPVRVRT